MGTYLYTVRSKVVKVQDQDFLDRDAYLVSYVHKDSLFGPKLSDRQRDFAENALWKAQNTHGRSAYFIVGDKPEDGGEVYEGWDKAVWYDSEPIPGKLVGWLKHGHNRRWYVVKESPWKRFLSNGLEMEAGEHETLIEIRSIFDENGKTKADKRYADVGSDIGTAVTYARRKGYLAGFASDGKPIIFWGNPKTASGEEEFAKLAEKYRA